MKGLVYNAMDLLAVSTLCSNRHFISDTHLIMGVLSVFDCSPVDCSSRDLRMAIDFAMEWMMKTNWVREVDGYRFSGGFCHYDEQRSRVFYNAGSFRLIL